VQDFLPQGIANSDALSHTALSAISGFKNSSFLHGVLISLQHAVKIFTPGYPAFGMARISM
jgi:hypothetical protein